MITPLLRPDLFGGLATHAGDALFEVCYALDFAPAARALRACATSSCRWSMPPWSTPASPSITIAWELEASFFGGAVKAAADDAYEVIGKEINLGSPKQLQVVLFNELGVRRPSNKTGYTTDADALQALYIHDRAPVPRGAAAAPQHLQAARSPSTDCSSPLPTTDASTRPTTR